MDRRTSTDPTVSPLGGMAGSAFWDALATHHAAIEDSYLDLRSVRLLRGLLRPPVLVVGAGQGLIVAELRKAGLRCDGIDLSLEMLRQAARRRGLDLIQADARALPFAAGAYGTVLCATGVVDFLGDETAIGAILREGRRVAAAGGRVLVAFYRLSAATEDFVSRLGLLSRGVLRHRETLELYRLNPAQAMGWVAKRAGVGAFRAFGLLLRSWAGSTWQERRNAFRMQRIFGQATAAEALLRSAPEELACRNPAEIRALFARLEVPIREFRTFSSCHVVEL